MAPEDVKANLPDHLAYQAQLERAGQLAFAGPMSDESGDHMQGVGLIIYRADSLEAARALAEGDQCTNQAHAATRSENGWEAGTLRLWVQRRSIRMGIVLWKRS